jgi:hypothetical protein
MPRSASTRRCNRRGSTWLTLASARTEASAMPAIELPAACISAIASATGASAA